MDEMFWRRVICLGPAASHCLLSCCVYTPLFSRTQTAKVLLCLPSQPPRLASRLRHSGLFCVDIKARRVGSVGPRGSGGGSPAGTKPERTGVAGPLGDWPVPPSA